MLTVLLTTWLPAEQSCQGCHLALRKAKYIKYGLFWSLLALKFLVWLFWLFFGLFWRVWPWRHLFGVNVIFSLYFGLYYTMVPFNYHRSDRITAYAHLPLPYTHSLTNGYLLYCPSQRPVTWRDITNMSAVSVQCSVQCTALTNFLLLTQIPCKLYKRKSRRKLYRHLCVTNGVD